MSTQCDENNVRYLAQVFDDIEVERDIKFCKVTNYRGELEELGLDIYQPSGDVEAYRPAILFIHGGAFRTRSSKKQSYIVELATRFTKKGYVCISSDYRLRDNPFENFNDALSDATSDTIHAFGWIRHNCEKYRIDRNRIIVAGGSAGGMVAVNLCYGNSINISNADQRSIFGLIDLWGTPSESSLNITSESTPALIVHGTKDEYVPIINSEKLVDELESKGVCHTFLKFEDAPHTPKMYMEQIIDTMTQFLIDLQGRGK